jgi:hypothetical protein
MSWESQGRAAPGARSCRIYAAERPNDTFDAHGVCALSAGFFAEQNSHCRPRDEQSKRPEFRAK